jgi:hypothetical protein
MNEPVSGILGREGELARVTSFIGSVPGGPSALLLEGAAGIGKTTLWQAGVSIARARGHRVLSRRGAEPEALLSYAALGDLFDFELPDLPAPQQRALDAALLRAELEGAPPDQRAVSVASLGVLRALAASGPVLVAIDDVQWLDVPLARALAFVVRRLEDAPVRVLVTLRVGSGGDPLGLGRTGPAPVLHRLPIGRLSEEAMTRLLRARTEGRLTHPILLRVHRMSEGNPLFALEIARALTEHGVRPAPGEALPVPGDLQGLLAARLAALPSSAADGLLVVAAAARPTEDLVVAAAARPDRASADLRRAEQAGILQRAGGRLAFTHPLLGSTVYAAAMPQARRSVHRRLADLVVDPEERARHLALAASGPHPDVARALEEAGRHARRGGAPDAAAELLELARTLTPPEDGLELLRRSVEAADYHFDAGDATRATALLYEAAAMARPGRDRARILFHLASISWLDMPRVQGLSEQALQEAGDAADIRAAIHEHLAWVGIYRGGLRRRARQRVPVGGRSRSPTPAIRAESLSTFAMVEFLTGRPARDLMTEAVQLEDVAMRKSPEGRTTVFTASRTCHGLQLLWAGQLDAAREVLHQERCSGSWSSPCPTPPQRWDDWSRCWRSCTSWGHRSPASSPACRIFHKLGVRSRTEITRRIATTHGQQPTSTSAGMEPTPATAQLPGQVWRRIVIVAAMVSAMVGGVVAVAGRTTATEAGVGELRIQAPRIDSSCRQLSAIPKRGWVCGSHRP